MKKISKHLIVLLFPSALFAQYENPTEALTGKYHLMESERGMGNEQTKENTTHYAWADCPSCCYFVWLV